MATRKTTKSARKALKKTTPRKSTARKAAAKKATKKAATKKAAKKATRPAAKKTAVRKAPAKKATKRTAATKAAASKGTARKAATKTPRKSAAKQASRAASAKKVAKKTSRTSTRAPATTPGVRGEKTPRSTARKAVTRPAGASGVTEQEKAQRRRAARKDATTTIEPADGATTNFSTTTAATPRDTDRGTSRTRKAHKITPEEALENTRQLLEAKQARDREPPPWRQLDTEHGRPAGDQAIPARTAEQEAEVNARAEELHRAESRLDAIQGSVSQQDRHRQGRNDARD